MTPVANLPPVSTTLVKLPAKFAAAVVDTGGNLPQVSLTPVANLPPVLLTPVANLPLVSTTLVKLATGTEVFRNHRKFPAIFTMKKGRMRMVGSNSIPLDY